MKATKNNRALWHEWRGLEYVSEGREGEEGGVSQRLARCHVTKYTTIFGREQRDTEKKSTSSKREREKKNRYVTEITVSVSREGWGRGRRKAKNSPSSSATRDSGV